MRSYGHVEAHRKRYRRGTSCTDLRDDPEEELDLFLTPRPDGEFRRYEHFPDFAREIDGLADRLIGNAEAIGDGWGAELGRRVKAEIAPRLAALAD